MKRKLSIGGVLIALGLIGLLGGTLTVHVGCTSKTDPVTGQTTTTVDLTQAPQNVDLAVDLVEAYAAVFANKNDYARIVDYAERLRRAADLPALQKLLAQIKGGSPVVVPATQPSQ